MVGRLSVHPHPGEDKTWTRSPWTATLDRIHGPPVMNRVHGHFFLSNEN